MKETKININNDTQHANVATVMQIMSNWTNFYFVFVFRLCGVRFIWKFIGLLFIMSGLVQCFVSSDIIIISEYGNVLFYSVWFFPKFYFCTKLNKRQKFSVSDSDPYRKWIKNRKQNQSMVFFFHSFRINNRTVALDQYQNRNMQSAKKYPIPNFNPFA